MHRRGENQGAESDLETSVAIVFLALVLALAPVLSGCKWQAASERSASLSPYVPFKTQIEYPIRSAGFDSICTQFDPITIDNLGEIEFRDLTLDEAIALALEHNAAFRNLGTARNVVPASVAVQDVAIRETDPRFGVEAALAAFDASYSASLFHSRNDRIYNNPFSASGVSGGLVRTGNGVELELRKPTAIGTIYSLRATTEYNRDNSTQNLFGSSYDTLWAAELRHPLLQGGGLQFNRIAGPQSVPGQYNGVLVARTNTDISIADFEIATQDLVRDVTIAYWELLFAYRDFDAKKTLWQANLDTWKVVKKQAELGKADLEREALARSRNFLARGNLENSFSGTGGAGLLPAERNLRFLMGIEINDGMLLRPAEEPPSAPIVCDWTTTLSTALYSRVELRRQHWQIKRRELEIIAAKNFLLPKLDLVGQAGVRGFGDHFGGNDGSQNFSALESLFSDGSDEFRIELQLSQTIGRRQASLALRNARLQLARERSVLRDLQDRVNHQLTNAVTEMNRAFQFSSTTYNRVLATQQQLTLIEKKYENGKTNLEFLLDAQGQSAQAESDYFRAQVDYGLAVNQFLYASGRLLREHQVLLQEGPFSQAAHQAAAAHARRVEFDPVLRRSSSMPPIAGAD